MLERIKNTTSFIRNRLGISSVGGRFAPGGDSIECGCSPAPAVGIILGSGLGELVEHIDVLATLDYDQIPDFPRSTVEGHRGRFIYGTLGGKFVIAMQGRVHYYEGYAIEDVVLPVRAMCCLGIETLIVSNAAGGLSPLFSVGDIMVIDDQINLIPNPLIGRNIDELGPRFPDMSEAYDRELIVLAHRVADEHGYGPLRQGCYVGSTGPSFETGAEYRYFRAIGADTTGMSTTPEVIVARHQGVRVLGFSIVTNAGIADPLTTTEGKAGVGSHAEVMQAAAGAAQRLSGLVALIVERM